jgi:hypothetical protein
LNCNSTAYPFPQKGVKSVNLRTKTFLNITIKIAFHKSVGCTDKKENQIFLIYKDILSGAVAKSYMTNGLLMYGEICNIRKPFLIYDFATAPL